MNIFGLNYLLGGGFSMMGIGNCQDGLYSGGWWMGDSLLLGRVTVEYFSELTNSSCSGGWNTLGTSC